MRKKSYKELISEFLICEYFPNRHLIPGENFHSISEEQKKSDDDTAAVAKEVKQYMKKCCKGKLVVRSKGGKPRFIMVRAAEIDNKVRKKVLDVVSPNANVSNPDDISYGNVTKRIVSAPVDAWKKVMKD